MALQAWSILALRRGQRVRTACCCQYISGSNNSSIHRLHIGVRAMCCISRHTPCHQKSTKAHTLDVHFVSPAPVGAGLVPAQSRATTRVAPTWTTGGVFMKWTSIDLQKMNWKMRAGLAEHTGV